MIDNAVARLSDQLAAAGIPLIGLRQAGGAFVPTFDPSATPPQVDLAAALIAAFDPTPPEGEKLDAAGLPLRVLAAVTIRASTQWTGLSVARKTRVQAIIDAAATQIAALLGP